MILPTYTYPSPGWQQQQLNQHHDERFCAIVVFKTRKIQSLHNGQRHHEPHRRYLHHRHHHHHQAEPQPQHQYQHRDHGHYPRQHRADHHSLVLVATDRPSLIVAWWG